MEISNSGSDGKVQLAISGVIDEKGAEKLKATFGALPITKGIEVTIDCRQLEQIGSSGIGKLLLLYKNLTANGGRLTVVNLPAGIHKLFLELKLDTLFTVSKAT